jgi:hypothetical protein
VALALKRAWRSYRSGFHRFGTDIAGIINTVLLLAVYIIGVGITSLIAKLAGKRFLETRKKRSYWVNTHDTDSPNSFYRQF